MCRTQGVALSDCFANSFCLSADVTAAYDPNFADVYDKRNSAFVNYGVALCKYTGSGGKGGASDASAEVVGKVRKLMNDNGVFWQMAEMGKTDAGGGGTVAKFMAQRNIDTLDAGRQARLLYDLQVHEGHLRTGIRKHSAISKTLSHKWEGVFCPESCNGEQSVKFPALLLA